MKRQIIVTGSFDDLRSYHVRFLEEAGKLGSVNVILWPDNLIQSQEGNPPKFPLEERRYLLESIRYVDRVDVPINSVSVDALPEINYLKPDIWAVDEASDTLLKREYCEMAGIGYRVITPAQIGGFPIEKYDASITQSNKKRVIVTGCYDWLHSGHVRFFEEAAQIGDLYVVVGHDENVSLLKGKGHPLFSEEERCYMVQSVRFVKAAIISSGKGWMDAEPEIALLQPNIYVVNEDGNKPEKRQFCLEHGLEYVVLRRAPKIGLPRRESSHLRGF